MKFAFALIVASLFMLTGVELLCGAYLMFRHERRAHDERAATTGDVVRLEETEGSQHEGRGYAPVVRFASAAGQEIEFTSSVSTNPAAYKVGDKVAVRYDPARPGNAELDSLAARWFRGDAQKVTCLIRRAMVKTFNRLASSEEHRQLSRAKPTETPW